VKSNNDEKLIYPEYINDLISKKTSSYFYLRKIDFDFDYDYCLKLKQNNEKITESKEWLEFIINIKK